MKQKELIEFLQRQNDFLQGKLDEALVSVNSLTLTVEELRRQIASLEDMLRGKGAELNKEKAARQAVQRLQGSASEKQTKPQTNPAEAEPQVETPEKKHTNNGAKKKTHPECEVETIEIEPDSPDFNPELANTMRLQFGELNITPRVVNRLHELDFTVPRTRRRYRRPQKRTRR